MVREDTNQGGGVFGMSSGNVGGGAISDESKVVRGDTNEGGGSLTLSNTATLAVSPTATLSVGTTGTAAFSGNLVTFKSDATGTASLGQMLGTLTGATNVTVERYIPNNGFRSWRLLSVPTYSSGQTIRQAWQEGDANPLPKQNNMPGYGTQITGAFSSQAAATAAGLDSTSVNAALLTWNGTGWNNVNSTHQPINNFSSYFLYIRGERSQTVMGAALNASATTLRTHGAIYTGDQAIMVGANAFAVAPNLYPSAIDFSRLTRTGGVNNLFYIWDSKKLNGNSLGMYHTFSATNNFNCMISGGSYVLGQPNTRIESGQGFFVKSDAAGSVLLKESAKINSSSSSGLRPALPGMQSKIDTRLYNDLNEMADANTVVFDAAYHKAIGNEDAPKMGNPGINFAIEKDDKLLSVEGSSPLHENDTIQFRMWNIQAGAYQLEFETSNLPEGITAVLEDSYLQTGPVIDPGGITRVSFTVTRDAGSSAGNRFRVVFSKTKPVVVDKKGFSIAPNPVENRIVNILFSNQAAGRYAVRMANNEGKTVFVKTISHAGGNSNQLLQLPAAITSGTYRVEITDAGKKAAVINVFVINR